LVVYRGFDVREVDTVNLDLKLLAGPVVLAPHITDVTRDGDWDAKLLGAWPQSGSRFEVLAQAGATSLHVEDCEFG
jgi:hypothetical protein